MNAKTVWLTGVPSAGKTTIARALMEKLTEPTQLLDGDLIRTSPISEDLGFSDDDRRVQCRRVGYMASLLNKNGVTCVVALVSPFEEHRRAAFTFLSNVVPVYVKCSENEARNRDVKGLYKKLDEGKIKGLSGIDAPYEEPVGYVTLDTTILSLDECVQAILDWMF